MNNKTDERIILSYTDEIDPHTGHVLKFTDQYGREVGEYTVADYEMRCFPQAIADAQSIQDAIDTIFTIVSGTSVDDTFDGIWTPPVANTTPDGPLDDQCFASWMGDAIQDYSPDELDQIYSHWPDAIEVLKTVEYTRQRHAVRSYQLVSKADPASYDGMPDTIDFTLQGSDGLIEWTSFAVTPSTLVECIKARDAARGANPGPHGERDTARVAQAIWSVVNPPAQD